jgi:hypothetical protein
MAVRRRWTTAMGMICGGMLAACSTPLIPAATPPSAAEPPIVRPPPPRPEPPRRPPPAATAPTAAAPSAPQATPEGLKGLSRDEAAALLGQPTARTQLATGTVWTYRRGGCALSLLFYPEVESGVERVLGYETEGGADAAACLKRLREAGDRHGR